MQEAPITKEEMDETREETPTEETPEETEEETETPEETPQEEKPEAEPEKSKELQSALAQKKHYKEKADKAQKELDKFKKASDTNLPSPANPMEVVKLAKALEGYSEEEVSFISRNASGDSIDDIINATKDDWVKTAIQSKRDKVELEKATPSPTAPASLKGKTEADLKKMSGKDYNSYIKKIAKNPFSRRRGI